MHILTQTVARVQGPRITQIIFYYFNNIKNIKCQCHDHIYKLCYVMLIITLYIRDFSNKV